MHWSTKRALTTIAQQRHAQLDAALDEALHRDEHPRPGTGHVHARSIDVLDRHCRDTRPSVHRDLHFAADMDH